MEPNQGNNPNNGKKPGGDRPKGSYFTPLMIALILVLLFIGGVNTACPQLTWHLDVGWKVKDAEPSEAALAWNRIVGVVLLLIAVVMMIV